MNITLLFLKNMLFYDMIVISSLSGHSANEYIVQLPYSRTSYDIS